MEISNDISLSFYLELKRKVKHLVSFPLHVDVNEIEFVNNLQCLEAANFKENDMMQLQVCEAITDNSKTSVKKLPSIEKIVVDVYNSISLVEETMNERGSDIISVVIMDGIAKDKVFINKTLVKINISVYMIHNNFQFKISKSDEKEYMVNCINDKCEWTFMASRLGRTYMFKVRYIKMIIRAQITSFWDIIIKQEAQQQENSLFTSISQQKEHTLLQIL